MPRLIRRRMDGWYWAYTLTVTVAFAWLNLGGDLAYGRDLTLLTFVAAPLLLRLETHWIILHGVLLVAAGAKAPLVIALPGTEVELGFFGGRLYWERQWPIWSLWLDRQVAEAVQAAQKRLPSDAPQSEAESRDRYALGAAQTPAGLAAWLGLVAYIVGAVGVAYNHYLLLFPCLALPWLLGKRPLPRYLVLDRDHLWLFESEHRNIAIPLSDVRGLSGSRVTTRHPTYGEIHVAAGSSRILLDRLRERLQGDAATKSLLRSGEPSGIL